MTLSQSQLRFIASVGVGVLVGTSLIVIIPEGVEAISSTVEPSHSHNSRHAVLPRKSNVRWERAQNTHGASDEVFQMRRREAADPQVSDLPSALSDFVNERADEKDTGQKAPAAGAPEAKDEEEHHGLPTFYIGFSLILGFILMFLIDRLPRHATDKFQPAPTTRHISLDNLETSSVSGVEDTEGFLGSLAPTPKQSRSLATTIGLVIHAAADGIAMGASATTSNMKLGLIIFVAIMLHKAPAAFGLTSLLLKQGLSKRAARGHLIVFSLAAPFGALTTYSIISLIGGGDMEGEAGQWWTGMLLLFSAGTFL